MATKKIKANIVIHGASIAAAAAGAGLAQIPTSDNAAITPIQVSMIIALGKIQGVSLDKSAALVILSTASAGIVGRTVSQVAVGWIPGYGNAINASTAAGITEAIGWSAFAVLNPDK